MTRVVLTCNAPGRGPQAAGVRVAGQLDRKLQHAAGEAKLVPRLHHRRRVVFSVHDGAERLGAPPHPVRLDSPRGEHQTPVFRRHVLGARVVELHRLVHVVRLVNGLEHVVVPGRKRPSVLRELVRHHKIQHFAVHPPRRRQCCRRRVRVDMYRCVVPHHHPEHAACQETQPRRRHGRSNGLGQRCNNTKIKGAGIEKKGSDQLIFPVSSRKVIRWPSWRKRYAS